jgi:hypothetical protein
MQGYVNESEEIWMGICCLPFRDFRRRIQGMLQDIK